MSQDEILAKLRRLHREHAAKQKAVSDSPEGKSPQVDAALLKASVRFPGSRPAPTLHGVSIPEVADPDPRGLFRTVASEAEPSGEEVEADPRSVPDPIPKAVFWNAVNRLIAGESLAEIERQTGLSHRKVNKIRDWQAHPGKLGPHGRPGYQLYPGQTPSTVILRKLRRPRSH